MKTGKIFDCVEMKRKIQNEIAKEFEGISDEESNKIQMKSIADNPILGKFVKSLELKLLKPIFLPPKLFFNYVK